MQVRYWLQALVHRTYSDTGLGVILNEELRICYIVTNKEKMNIKKERYYT